MFYTRYRPQKFSEISRPNQAADALSTQVVNGKVAHAYLFVGPRGTGKTTTARILAKSLNCKKITEKGDPCGDCVVCNGVTNGSYIDLIEIDAASNRGIDDIRDLKSKINLTPSHGKKKIYIIDEVHMLTNEAFNALLKTLEEPPSHVHFVLCTTELHKVPETIKSRCQMFRFKRASIKQLVDKLDQIARDVSHKISKKDLEKIAKASQGGFRDAETMLEQVIEGGITVDDFLEASSSDSFGDFVSALANNDCKSAIRQLYALHTNGVDLHFWCGNLLLFLRELLFIKSGVSLEDDIPVADIEGLNVGEVLNLLEIFSAAHIEIKHAFVSQLPLEIAVLSVCNPNELKVSSKPTTAVPMSTQVQKPSSKNVKPSASEVKVVVEEVIEIEPVVSKSISSSYVPANLATTVADIKNKWDLVVSSTYDLNASVSALLKNVAVLGINGDILVLEVYYPFHKERLETQRNSTVVRNVLAEIFGEVIKFECKLGKNKPKKLDQNETGNLTDKNISLPSQPAAASINTDDLIGMLDGGLPL